MGTSTVSPGGPRPSPASFEPSRCAAGVAPTYSSPASNSGRSGPRTYRAPLGVELRFSFESLTRQSGLSRECGRLWTRGGRQTEASPASEPARCSPGPRRRADLRPHDNVDCGTAVPVDRRRLIPLRNSDSSAWIRTRDLTIMSRAPACEWRISVVTRGGESPANGRTHRPVSRRVQPGVLTRVDPWWTSGISSRASSNWSGTSTSAGVFVIRGDALMPTPRDRGGPSVQPRCHRPLRLESRSAHSSCSALSVSTSPDCFHV
jgi:hypothetical protein